MPDVKDLTDEALISIWEKVEDPGNLTEYEQQVIDEMERRGTEF